MSKKILVVDDSLFIREVLKGLLTKNYTVVEADTGSKALAQFEKENPDLTLLDIVMPEGEEEGIRVLQEIRKIDPKASVIMITAVGQDEIIKRCKKLGTKDYIVKPFDHQMVCKTVAKYLS